MLENYQGPQSGSIGLSRARANRWESEMKERSIQKQRGATAEEVALLSERLFALDVRMQHVVAKHEQRLKELEDTLKGNGYSNGHHTVENSADVTLQRADAHTFDHTPNSEDKSNVAAEALLQRMDDLETRQRGLEEENVELQGRCQVLEEVRKSDQAEEDWAEQTLKLGVDLTTQHIDGHSLGYPIEESMWDSIIFIGFKCIPLIDQIIILVGILMNIMIEFAFILVVIANYSVHSFPDDVLDGLLHWRAVVAHDFANADHSTQTSLAARVCMEEVSTEKSALQLGLYSELHSFRHSRLEALGFLNGYVLCNMALILWFFGIILDLVTNLKFTSAILMHPRGEARMKQYGQDDIQIISFSGYQVTLAICLVSIPRFAVAVSLGWAGVYFLAYTYNVNDLLLNAVALAFVLDIDEELFETLTPRRITTLTRTLAPLRNHSPDANARHIAKLQKKLESVAVRVFVTLVLLIIANIIIMRPFIDRLDKAMSYMCDGSRDVVFTPNQGSTLIMYANSPEYKVEVAHKMAYRKRAVLEIIGMDPDFFKDKLENLPGGQRYGNSSIELSLASLHSQTHGSRLYVSHVAMCIDHTERDQVRLAYPGKKSGEYQQASKLLLSARFGTSSITRCQQINFKDVCMSSAPVGRALCARHCGCDNPWTGQFFATGESGCPVSCAPRWALAAFYRVPSNITKFTDLCADVPAALLIEQDFWKNYVDGLKNHMLAFESELQVNRIAERLLTEGCGHLTKLRFMVDVCEPNDIFRSARLFCPATCMCAYSDMKECPSSCSYNMPHQMMSPSVPCPLGLEISSATECEHAAEEILMRVKHIDDYHENNGGCFLSHGYLYWTNGSVHNTIPSDYTILCKGAQPFFPNDISKGEFVSGKQCAECILTGSACAEDCYKTHSVPYNS